MDEDPICAAARGGLSDMIQPVMLAWCDFMAKQKDRRPSYLYYFNHDMPGDDHVGAYHSAELWYTFKTIHRCWRPMQGIDYHLADVMNAYDPVGEDENARLQLYFTCASYAARQTV